MSILSVACEHIFPQVGLAQICARCGKTAAEIAGTAETGFSGAVKAAETVAGEIAAKAAALIGGTPQAQTAPAAAVAHPAALVVAAVNAKAAMLAGEVRDVAQSVKPAPDAVVTESTSLAHQVAEAFHSLADRIELLFGASPAALATAASPNPAPPNLPPPAPPVPAATPPAS